MFQSQNVFWTFHQWVCVLHLFVFVLVTEVLNSKLMCTFSPLFRWSGEDQSPLQAADTHVNRKSAFTSQDECCFVQKNRKSQKNVFAKNLFTLQDGDKTETERNDWLLQPRGLFCHDREVSPHLCCRWQRGFYAENNLSFHISLSLFHLFKLLLKLLISVARSPEGNKSQRRDLVTWTKYSLYVQFISNIPVKSTLKKLNKTTWPKKKNI